MLSQDEPLEGVGTSSQENQTPACPRQEPCGAAWIQSSTELSWELHCSLYRKGHFSHTYFLADQQDQRTEDFQVGEF